MLLTPQAELYFHVMTKTTQLGGIFGTAIGGVAGGFMKSSTVTGGALTGAKRGMVIGLPLGIGMLYMRMNALKKVGYK